MDIQMPKLMEVKSILERALSHAGFESEFDEVGRVISLGDGIVQVHGMENAFFGEVVAFESGDLGILMSVESNSVRAVLLCGDSNIREGQSVKRTNKLLSVPVGDEMLGRAINAIGEPLDGLGKIEAKHRRNIEVKAPGIVDRQSVTEPIQTGIKAIDGLIPIGRGQRELIIGDRQTGKTSIAIDAILNQKRAHMEGRKDAVYCVYVAIGQKNSSVASTFQLLQDKGALSYTTVVVASPAEPAPFQFFAPYAGCAIAEHLMEQGKHVLIVYDDLSKHAVSYRQMSLLLRRPPGREAYPGDVFYIHSRLLERAAKLSDEKGGGSLTALPIIETQAGDVSAYIPTNVISITDGQIFLETDLFNQGQRPAVNLGLSVSRVGSAAQTKAMKKVAGSIKLDLAQYRELEAFTQFSSDVDDTAKNILERGKRLSALLKQRNCKSLSVAEQVALFFVGGNNYLKDVLVEEIDLFESQFLLHLNSQKKDLMDKIENTGTLDDDDTNALHEITKSFLERFLVDGRPA